MRQNKDIKMVTLKMDNKEVGFALQSIEVYYKISGLKTILILLEEIEVKWN